MKYLLNKKMFVPREHAETIQEILLNVPEFGYDFVLKKSKIKKKFKKSSTFVAFFININGGIDHYEVQKEEEEQGYREFKIEPETEFDYTHLL